MLTYILFSYKATLAQDFTECRQIKPEVVPPQVIKTVPYKAQQTKSIPIPKPLLLKVIDLLQQRQKRRIVEDTYRSYCNNQFLVIKKDRGLHLINNVQQANTVTVQDTFTLPGAKEFSKDFSSCKVISLLDLFLGYNQIALDP